MPIAEVAAAHEFRKSWGYLKDPSREICRIFHGPGEGSGGFEDFAIDWFCGHVWITNWRSARDPAPELTDLTRFLASIGAQSAVALSRPEKGLPELPVVVLGKPPEGRFEVQEKGLRMRIQMEGARHPGLFLDHAPLRGWLRRNAQGMRILNTFAYTGSLSVAAGLGGAREVVTLDLSKATTDWAAENWRANGLPETPKNFIFGDVFDWLPRFRKAGRTFDCVILDPPSFSRGTQGPFSTSKDLVRLHDLALGVLAPGGVLITSINSADISRERFEKEVETSTHFARREFDLVQRIELPETFPVRPHEEGYLKGLILRERT